MHGQRDPLTPSAPAALCRIGDDAGAQGVGHALPRGVGEAHESANPSFLVDRHGTKDGVRRDADDGRVRALVRFPYAAGAAVTETLRASVVAEAAQSRRGRGRQRIPLAVHLDILEPDI